MTEQIDVEDLIERLRYAHENSQQRVNGSNIFEEAADALEALSEAVDSLGEHITELQARCYRCRTRPIATGLLCDLCIHELAGQRPMPSEISSNE